MASEKVVPASPAEIANAMQTGMRQYKMFQNGAELAEGVLRLETAKRELEEYMKTAPLEREALAEAVAALSAEVKKLQAEAKTAGANVMAKAQEKADAIVAAAEAQAQAARDAADVEIEAVLNDVEAHRITLAGVQEQVALAEADLKKATAARDKILQALKG